LTEEYHEEDGMEKPKRNPFEPLEHKESKPDFFNLRALEQKQRHFFEEDVAHEENGIAFHIARFERLAYLLYINKGVFSPLAVSAKQRTMESPWEVNLSLQESLEFMFYQGYVRAVNETNPSLWVEMQSKMQDWLVKRLSDFSKQIILP